MVAQRIFATPVIADAISARDSGSLGVGLYKAGSPDFPGLGGHLHASAVRYLPNSPSELSWDFLSIALAAFAADRFVLRQNSEDGWTRVLPIDIALSNPVPWIPQIPQLESTFRFLTGDIWQISLRRGGSSPPKIPKKFSDRDQISLFSGGLDSLLGALKLLSDGKRPFLVSQGSTKEVGPQIRLARAIGLSGHRFDGRVNEKWRAPYEGSTRGRSLIFFAYGAVAASSHDLNKVIVPENGLIAINPPLTMRRVGSLSTRTTHPFLMDGLNSIFANVGMDVVLENIFEGHTKGQMMIECDHPQLAELSTESYSCGKGKRWNGQCGRCVPCLIRRSAFHASGVPDGTRYTAVLERSSKNDDVLAAKIAAARAKRIDAREMSRWINRSGPLPPDPARRAFIEDAVARGLAEMGDFIDGVAWR